MKYYEKLPTHLLCIFNSSQNQHQHTSLTDYITSLQYKATDHRSDFFKYSLFGCDMTADIGVTVSGLENSRLHDIFIEIQSSGEKMSLRSEV